MSLSPKTIRTQLALLRPLLDSCSLETIRKGQNMIGELRNLNQRSEIQSSLMFLEGKWVYLGAEDP